MPASELHEWSGMLHGEKPELWGHYRETALWLAQNMNILSAPHAGDPGALIRRLDLPWRKPRAVENVQQVSPDQFRAFLMSIGANPVEASHASDSDA